MTSYRELVDPLYETLVTWKTADLYLERTRGIREDLALLFGAHLAYWEIGNGGFTQFFWNSSGIVAPEAVRGFRMLGMPRSAEIVERAMLHFGQPFPRDWETRQAMFDEGEEPFGGEEDAVLAALDAEMFPLVEEEAGGFEAAADRYAERLSSSSSSSSS
jgi:hypothetical protein